MNNKGHKYIEEINLALKDAKLKGLVYTNPTRSEIIERCMRLGREVKVFELDDNYHSELEKIANATLKEDSIKNYKRNLNK